MRPHHPMITVVNQMTAEDLLVDDTSATCLGSIFLGAMDSVNVLAEEAQALFGEQYRNPISPPPPNAKANNIVPPHILFAPLQGGDDEYREAHPRVHVNPAMFMWYYIKQHDHSFQVLKAKKKGWLQAKIQKEFSKIRNLQLFAKCVSQSEDVQAEANLRAAALNGTTGCLAVRPTHDMITLSNSEFSSTLQHRMDVIQYGNEILQQCSDPDRMVCCFHCKERLSIRDLYQHVSGGCPKTRGGGTGSAKLKHDAVVLALKAAMGALEVPSEHEPDVLPLVVDAKTGKVSGRRLDLIVYLHNNVAIGTDNRLVNTTARSYAAATVRDPMSALDVADREKKNKYEESCKKENYTFIPCSISSLGAPGKGAQQLFSALANYAYDQLPLSFPLPQSMYKRLYATVHFTVAKWQYKNWRHALRKAGLIPPDIRTNPRRRRGRTKADCSLAEWFQSFSEAAEHSRREQDTEHLEDSEDGGLE